MIASLIPPNLSRAVTHHARDYFANSSEANLQSLHRITSINMPMLRTYTRQRKSAQIGSVVNLLNSAYYYLYAPRGPVTHKVKRARDFEVIALHKGY
jgi:hypothetical protein